MTATFSSQRSTGSRYRGVVYGLDVIDHQTGVVVRSDYVGQTRQRGRGRENQHRDSQPWSDLIVGSPRVLWEGLCTDAELDEVERRFIQDPPDGVRPRLNWKLNEDNPQQIPKWILVEQRHQRDDQEGRTRWQPAEGRQRGSLLEWDTPPVRRQGSRPAVRRRWSTRRRHLTGLAIAWAATAIAAWIGLAVYRLLEPWNVQALTAVAGSLALVMWVWLGFPFVGRRWRRRARKAWRRLR